MKATTRNLKVFFTIVLTLFVSEIFAQQSYTFNEGLDAAKKGNKKILMDIYNESNSWSKKMDNEVFTNDNVKNLISDFVYIRLNADGSEKFSYNGKQYSSSELSKFLGATGFPTFVILNPNGTIISFKYNGEETSTMSGFMSVKDFESYLNYFTQNKYKDTDLSTFQN